MNKWITKLKKAEILEMHRFCVCPDTRKDFVIRSKKEGDFTFMEGGWECDGAYEYLETSYEYDDFSGPHCIDASDAPGQYKKFIEYMTKKFGKEYIADFMQHKTGTNKKIFLEVMQ